MDVTQERDKIFLSGCGDKNKILDALKAVDIVPERVRVFSGELVAITIGV